MVSKHKKGTNVIIGGPSKNKFYLNKKNEEKLTWNIFLIHMDNKLMRSRYTIRGV